MVTTAVLQRAERADSPAEPWVDRGWLPSTHQQASGCPATLKPVQQGTVPKGGAKII